jgi:integrase
MTVLKIAPTGIEVVRVSGQLPTAMLARLRHTITAIPRKVALLKRAGLPDEARMHDLRHTFATIMLDNGEDLVAVQRSLGHSRVNITADLYVGRVPTAQKKAVERYGELLRGSAATG